MPVSSRGPRRRQSWWYHTPLIDSGYPHACETGGAQMRPGCAHLLAMLQECHRLAGAFAAYPASYCATGSAQGPRLKVRRSPPPPHARALVRSPHNLGSQHSAHRTPCRAPDHTHAERQQPDGNPPSRRADHNDQATQSSSRWVIHRPGPLKTAGVEVRSSSRTLTSTRNPDQHPVTHTHLRRALFPADP